MGDYGMRLLLTGNRGYIGAVAEPILRSAGHEVVGLDTDLFAGCDFGGGAAETPEVRKDIRDLTKSDLEGFEAVVHLAALSNDPLGNLNRDLTYDINHTSFRPQWTACKGAQELYDAYRAAGLTAEDLESGRYTRMVQIQRLLKSGQSDDSLRRSPQPAVGTALEAAAVVA
jgi:hypothetical protein